jgi:hypothetical protein
MELTWVVLPTPGPPVKTRLLARDRDQLFAEPLLTRGTMWRLCRFLLTRCNCIFFADAWLCCGGQQDSGFRSMQTNAGT